MEKLLMYSENTTLDELIIQGANNFTSRLRTENEASRHALSKREIQIIKLVIMGNTSPKIAEQLFISEHTVRTHRKNIFKKLDIHHITELMKFAVRNGLD